MARLTEAKAVVSPKRRVSCEMWTTDSLTMQAEDDCAV